MVFNKSVRIKIILKFRFSEKATKMWKKSPTCFDVTESNQVVDFFSNFVAFSKCLNFNRLVLNSQLLVLNFPEMLEVISNYLGGLFLRLCTYKRL